MGQIIVNRSGGYELLLFSNSVATHVTKAEQRCALLAENVVQITVESAEPIDFRIGDWVDVFGSRYSLNALPQVTKNSKRRFVYELLFESVQYDLLKAQYFNADGSGLAFGGEFSLMGDLRRFIEVAVNNANRVFGSGAWVLGDCPDTDFRTLSFSAENCLAVLQRVCEEYEQEFEIFTSADVNTIHIRKAGQILPGIFEYGNGRGLYQLTRQTVSNKNIVTRLYAFGSTKNLKAGYRNYSTRLKLPGDDLSFIEDAAAKAAFGHIEASKTFEEVYPHRTGNVTSLGGDVYSFVDASMDFDLNESDANGTKYLIPGTSAKVHFNTGNLAGYEFEVYKYANDTKTFQIVPFKDERGQQFPSEDTVAFQIAAGDKYVLIDISMPPSYIEAAENELQEKAVEYLAQNSQPRVQYSLQVDEMYLKDQAGAGTVVNFFTTGDYLQVKDTDINVDKGLRIKAFTRNILSPYKYTLELSDVVEVSIIQRLIADTTELAKVVQINNLTNPARARNSWKTTQEALNMIFDQSGYFDTENIRPHSIETNMLAVGSIDSQLTLDVIIEANYGGNPQVVRTSSGGLAHFTLEENIRSWTISGATTNLITGGGYYIYARCQKTGSAGSIIFSTQQIKVDEDGTYYHFLLGILHSPDTGVRWISLTYGTTSINGRFIKTGRVQSADGQTFFDLDAGQIGGKIIFSAGSSGYNNLADKPDLSEYAAAAYVNAIRDDLQGQIDGNITSWFQDHVPTLVNLPASDWATSAEKDIHLGDLFYHQSTGYAYRFAKNGSVYEWIRISDTDITLALSTANDALDTADGKRRVFITEPVTPYDVGDLWAQGASGEILRCITARASGTFNSLDWGKASSYDNTKTTIDGGVITSGTIQLAGDDATIKAGVSGIGTADADIRFWAGATTSNRDHAPFRVNQGGEVVARKRIELQDENELGQGGICGSNVSGDGDVRIWAGSPYADRNTAPFWVKKDGSIKATKGTVGGLTIQGNNLVNDFSTDAAVIMRNDAAGTFMGIGTNVLPGSSGLRALARIENKESNSFGTNYGAIFQASGALENYAIYNDEGIAFLKEAQINGRRAYHGTHGNVTLQLDAWKYDYISIYATVNPVWLELTGLTDSRIADGKEITIMPTNNIGVTLINTIRGHSGIGIAGGVACTIFYCQGEWYIKSLYDNNW